MEFSFSPADEIFREEVRDWLATHIPREKRPPGGHAALDYDKAWQRIQYDGGWAGLDWPAEYGGRGLTALRQLIWMQESARLGAPPVGDLYIGLNHGGPTLIALGTGAQKDFHLKPILTGDHVWCQGFSEPGAGSDLAGIRTRGEIDGDHLVVNGQKIWTSYAHHADFQELLVRTGGGSKKHEGMTWVICDMKLPGITIRPIRDMSGAHHLNEVFYDNVRIPIANVVGGVGNGWKTAMSTLGFERGTGMICVQLEMAHLLEAAIAYARETTGADGRKLIEREDLAMRLAGLRAEVSALRAMAYMNISRHERRVAGLEGTLAALFHGELERRVSRIVLEVAGMSGLELHQDYGNWARRYLGSFPMSIAGGTSQVRRNIISERLLGMPR